MDDAINWVSSCLLSINCWSVITLIVIFCIPYAASYLSNSFNGKKAPSTCCKIEGGMVTPITNY